MNKAESHAWKFAASCAVDEMLRIIQRVLLDGISDRTSGVECQLLLPRGTQLSWRSSEELAVVLSSLIPLLESDRAHHAFEVRMAKPEATLLWQCYVQRGSLPSLSCGLDGSGFNVDDAARSLAEKVLLEQLSRGCWSFLYQATAREWVGDPVWIYLKHKCDRITSIRDRLLKDRCAAATHDLSAAMGLHSLLTSCLEQQARRVLVARVGHRRLESFLVELDQLLRSSVASASLESAVAPLGVGLAGWFGPD